MHLLLTSLFDVSFLVDDSGIGSWIYFGVDTIACF